MIKIINVFLLLIVGVSAWFLFVGYESDIRIVAKPQGHLSKAIPSSVDGWTSKEIPLGATEEVKRSVEKNLAVNEYLNREYTSPSGKIKFTVYISYWGSGKEDVKTASAHTPDRCWAYNGWISDKSKMRSDYLLQFDDVKLMPAYYREMKFLLEMGEVNRYITFWHIVDGKRYVYVSEDAYYSAFSFRYVKQAFEAAFIGAPEQYFVRVDSQFDFEQLKSEKGFQDIMKSLAKLILEDKSAETAKEAK